MKIILIIISVIISLCSFSQNGWWEKNKTANDNNLDVENSIRNDNDTISIQPGKITIIKSESIEKIINFKSAVIPPNSEPTMDGYRVQLFFDQDKKKISDARTKILNIDNEISTYVEYEAPYYFLLLGDYRTKLEAEKKRAEMAEEFNEAIVKKMKIFLPKINTEEKITPQEEIETLGDDKN